MSRIIGIDLGTTYSLVSYMAADGPRIIPNRLGESLTPSAVALLPDGTTVVGAPARARATTDPERTARSFKRDMGTARPLRLGARTFSPPELSALVLSSLRSDAEEHLGEKIEEAVITVPAYFNDLQRQATRDAGAIAGLKVERLLNEPTAAALAYGLNRREKEARVAVLDLGGGTFDVTVLEIIEGVVEIQATAGDVALGGDDFDVAIARHLATRDGFDRLDTDDPVTAARLLEVAHQAKHALSHEETTRVVLVDALLRSGKRHDLELELSRTEAEGAFVELVERMRAPIFRALADAGKTPGQIDEVLLVGGSTRMPCVSRMGAQLFGRLPLRTLPPDEAVALGAAVQAALKADDAAVEDLVVTDVAPFSLGIAVAESFGARHVDGVFRPLLERGTVIPASRESRFSTMHEGQREIHVEVYQGEHALCRDNLKLGEYKITGLMPGPAGEQTIDVRFTYDLNGLLEVDVKVTKTGLGGTLVIERGAGAMTPAQVEAARKAMARLKLHPREALPNTTALARADALYAELTGDMRAFLGQHIAAFRDAMERQEPKAIEAMRDSLTRITRDLRGARPSRS